MTGSVSPTNPITLTVDYPDRALDRLSSALRMIWAIPAIVVLALLEVLCSPGH